MRARYFLSVSVALACQACSANGLVSSYYMENQNYIISLVSECLMEAKKVNLNAIDSVTGLPVKEINEVGLSMPFMVDTVSVNFQSSENAIHRVWSLSCNFDRSTSKLKALSSFNHNDQSKNIFEASKTILPKEYNIQDEAEYEEKVLDLYFGIKLDYPAVLEELKKLKNK